MKFFWLLCVSLLVYAHVGEAKAKPQMLSDGFSPDEEKRSNEPSDEVDVRATGAQRSVDDEDKDPETPKRENVAVREGVKRKDNIEDVILKELDDLKFSYTKGKKGARGKDTKTEVLSTDEPQVKESAKLDMPDLEQSKISNIMKNKGDSVKNINGNTDDNDDDMKLHIPTLSSKLEGLLSSHEKKKFIDSNKHTGSKHKIVGSKKNSKGDDVKAEDDSFAAHDNMETTVTPETVSNDVMIRRMKNIKTMKHGIPDLENSRNKKEKKKLTAAKQAKAAKMESKDFKLNNALLGDVNHDDAKTTSPDTEGSGAKENVDISEKSDARHNKAKDEPSADTKPSNVEVEKEEAEKSEFAAEKLNEKEARGPGKAAKGNKVTNLDEENNDVKEEEAVPEKVEKPIAENIPKKKIAPAKKTKNSSEALESGMESGSNSIANKSASDIKYNLNLENVKLKDVNLKIPDLENSKLGRMIGSKSVKVNVSVDVVKLEGMQIKVPESASAAPIKNQSLVFNELQEYKNNKNNGAESVVDDVRNADFRAIEEVKNVGGNVAGTPNKVSIPESEILKFADKNKDVQVKGITINNFKDLQAMPNKAAKESNNENKKKKEEKEPKKMVEKLEKVKFASDEAQQEEAKVESGSFGNKEKSIKIKSIKIKGLNNIKLDDLKSKNANKNKSAPNAQTFKAGTSKEKELKIKGVRIKASNGLHLKDIKLEDESATVTNDKKISKEHGGKKKSSPEFSTLDANEETKEDETSTKSMKSPDVSEDSKPTHEKSSKGKAKSGKKVKMDDLHLATTTPDEDVHIKSSADNGKSDKKESAEKLSNDIEVKAKSREEKHKSKKSSEKKEAKEAKETAGHNKESQRVTSEKVVQSKGIHLNEEKEGKKEDIHVEGVSRFKGQSEIKLDDEKAGEDNDAKDESDKKAESDASARSSEEEYEKAFKLNLDKGKELSSNPEEQNIENILHFKNENDDTKGFKMNEDDDKSDDLLGEGSPLFHDNNISGVSHHENENTEETTLDTKKETIANTDAAKRQVIPSAENQKRYVIRSW